ncbi:MAG: cardiolipin synthetase (Cardiolipin synthase)-like protein [Ramlibacter sp.]|nr:cardiolipin synthetase (Cardiolipin synthase)-like protein [Ramlibacter sp.]
MQHSIRLKPTQHHAGAIWGLMLRWLVAFALSTAAAGCASLPANATDRPVSKAFMAPDQTALGRLVLERKAQQRSQADSGFNLLDSVDAAFGSRLAMIDGAQRTLDLQYYAIHADSSTEILLQRLRDAARRGVRVRVLLDDFNTVGDDAQVLRLAFEPNVEIRLFNPLPGSRSSLIGRVVTSLKDLPRMQKRMHNKLFIADNAIGITGGRNLGDAYFGGDGKSAFIDLEVLAMGRVVRDMSASFDRFWNDELAYPVQTLISKKELEELRKPPTEKASDPSKATPSPAPAASMPAPTLTSAILPPESTPPPTGATQAPMDLRTVPLTWAPSLVMVDEPGKIGPGDDEADAGETVVDGLLNLMLQAKQDVLIISPYFVPGQATMEQFRQLRAKGIRVRVLTNSLASNDAPAAHAGYARYRKDLVALGIEVYEMRAAQEGTMAGMGSTRGFGSSAGGGSKSGSSRASLHSKAVVIDNRLLVVGSMNLDLRSQRKNSEVALVIRSAAMSRLATRQVEATFAQGAYKLEMDKGDLVWRAPPGASFKDAHSEPDASTKLRLLVRVIAPFAPDEML